MIQEIASSVPIDITFMDPGTVEWKNGNSGEEDGMIWNGCGSECSYVPFRLVLLEMSVSDSCFLSYCVVFHYSIMSEDPYGTSFTCFTVVIPSCF